MRSNTAALSAFCLMASAHVASTLRAQTNFYDQVTLFDYNTGYGAPGFLFMTR